MEREVDLYAWIPPEEEDRTAPVRELEEWTGIRKEQLNSEGRPVGFGREIHQ